MKKKPTKTRARILDSRPELHFTSTEQIQFLFSTAIRDIFFIVISIKQAGGLKVKQIIRAMEELTILSYFFHI